MIKVGNTEYTAASDLPDEVPVFPLAGALLLPGSQLPLNIFEPRYISMFDDCLAGPRIIGVIQPSLEHDQSVERPVGDLCAVGCLGRILGYGETGDGRYVLTLGGVCRFRVSGEVSDPARSYRVCRISPEISDLSARDMGETVDREELLKSFRAYLDANNLEVDWKSVEKASNATLVNSLSMMSPYGPAEKQALLEARDIKARADTLIAITEMVLAQSDEDTSWRLQ
ncbi:MAG: ATP-dependent protease [Rhizobiales bacterium]|nr:ATP-dependent protease [Hyphomicrobiales bacterium]MBA69066.1 ATP-dependent protease [Hyphomicrobiales bacterium]|tara:strand:+ start:1702 stop:2382 length:681 start_codon:yes stop_codon:yes gene_type:complete